MPYAICHLCNRSFANDATLQQHLTTVHAPTPYCDTCIEWFPSHRDLEHHISTSEAHALPPSLACTSCSLTFACEADLAEHLQNSLLHKYTAGQFYCDECVLWFSDQEALDRHLRDSGEHATQFACVDCGREFGGRRELEAHLLMQVFCSEGIATDDHDQHSDDGGVGLDFLEFEGGVKSEGGVASGSDTTRSRASTFNAERDGHVEDCLDWPSLTNPRRLHDHTSQGYRCLGETCLRSFASPSALLQHLDSGACSSGINRHLVNAASISTDHTSLFTNRLLRASAGRNIHEVHENAEESARKAYNRLNQPTTTPQSPTQFQHLQQPQQLLTHPGSPYQCPLCDKAFRSPLSLHAHMNSSVHDTKIYHCPRTTSAVHEPDSAHETRNFSTLGSLAQHLEGAGCISQKGVSARFGNARRFNANVMEVQEKLKKMAFRLEGSSSVWGSLEDGSIIEDYI